MFNSFPSPPVFDGGGGGVYKIKLPMDQVAEPLANNDHPTSLEAKIATSLGFDYYGFLLYHSGHVRIQNFLVRHLSFLDHACGSTFALFTLVAKHKHSLQIDQILARARGADQATWSELRNYRKRSEPFTPDLSFRAAEKLGLTGDQLPCLLIFRSRGQALRSFAILRLEDGWFPEIGQTRNGKSMATEMRWLVQFFDTLQKVTQTHDQREVLYELQRRMEALSRRQKTRQVKASLEPLVKLPFKLVETLPRVLEKVASDKLSGKEA